MPAAWAATVTARPWLENVRFWEQVGALGNTGLALVSLAGVFFFFRRATRGDAFALCAAVGLLLLAAAHALLPLSELEAVTAQLILPMGRGLRTAAAALLLPAAVVELWRVRPWRAAGQAAGQAAGTQEAAHGD